MSKKKVVLTGDRPTGPLHIGHYVGSLSSRLKLQEEYQQFVMIADVQALTDNFENPQKVHDNVLQVALDYLSIGLDPQKTTFFIQSMIPQIAELTVFYLNLVTVSRLERNPTIKTEIKQRGFETSLPAGFLMYPVSQAADITIVKGEIIPVGEDQLPVIEQANEIVRSFNRIYQTDALVEAKALISPTPRLVGTDGQAKMSKSLGNAIFLCDDADTVTKKVMSMYTDPNHIRVEDPGNVEGNVVFMYLDIFDDRKDEVQELKAHYQRGGLGDVKLKRRLIEVMNAFLDPIRTKRVQLAQHPDEVMKIMLEHTARVRDEVAAATMAQVKEAMKLNYLG